MAMVSNSSSGNTSGSTNATITFVTPTPSAFGSLPSKSAALNGADTCGCQASGVARTCYDCLNAKLLNDRSVRWVVHCEAVEHVIALTVS